MKCPCKECIVLAMCKDKTKVYCGVLLKVFKGVAHEDKEADKEIWDMIHETLPRVVAVGPEKSYL